MFSVIVSPAGIGTAGPFADGLEQVVAWVQSERAEHAPAVLLPGEPEQTAKAVRLREGIPLDANTWEQIVAAAEEVGLARSDFLERTSPPPSRPLAS